MWRKSKIPYGMAKIRCGGLIYLVCFGLVISLVATSIAKGVDPSLVGWWMFDESSGNIAYDSSGYDNNGTVNGNPQWAPGKVGGALAFDGTGDYVNCGNSPVFQIQEQITMACWIKVEKFTRDWSTIISKGDNSYRMGRPQGGNAIHLGIQGTVSSPYPWFDGRKAVADNQWHHVAGVYDGTQGIIYIDGILDVAQAATGQLNASDFNLYIGENSQATGRYWNGLIDDVRLYNRALSQTEIQQIILNIPPGLSSYPYPEDKATDVPRDVILSWKPGEYSDKHDVYFGTVFDDVNDASRTDPLGALVSQDQEPNTYDPDGLLDFGQTYYWRVDEVNAPPNETIFKGSVWSFTAEPFTYPIENIIVSASSFQKAGREPENTINGSGLDDNDLHSTDNAAMWLTSSVPQSVWIQYEFDKAYKLHEMWVWNYNSQFEYLLGFGLKDVTIEYSENGTDWTALGDFEFAQGPSANGYAHNTTIDFGGTVVKYVKLTVRSNWSGMTQYGLSEVRFLYKSVLARQPKPASGKTGVTPDAVLSWRAGREAASHELYFSNDMQAVIDGTAFIDTVSQSSYDISSLDLELGKTYYWKINEVNEAESPSSWEGDVWSFTLAEYLIVDDFEGYDDLCNRIFYTWIDGFGHSGDPACGVAPSSGNSTGSTVGHFNAPFAERTIVHEGRQSMPLGYDNSAAPHYSETWRQFDAVQGWSKGGVKTLTLYFYGDPANAAGQIYVKLNDSKVVYDGDAGKIQEARWNQWNIDLASFGVDLQNVGTLSIGVGNGNAGGSGTLYIDDIRLYRLAPGLVQPVDPGNNGLVANWKLDDGSGLTAVDSSVNANNGTLIGDPQWVVGQNGSALEFNGNDYVDCGNNASLNITEHITIASWVNTDDAGNGQHNPYLTKGDYSYALKHAAGNSIEFYIYDGGWRTISHPVDSSFNSVWHHLAGTYDGNELKLYIDGGLQAADEHVGSIATNNFNVNIGRNSEATDRFYEGRIDDVLIYNRALSEAEVLYLTGYE